MVSWRFSVLSIKVACVKRNPQKRQSRRWERGVIAAEFALTIPLLLGVFFTGAYLGMAQIRQAQMQAAAQSITRACGATAISRATLAGCIASRTAEHTSEQANCNGTDEWSSETTFTPSDADFNPLDPSVSVRFVALDLTCNYSWDFGIINVPAVDLRAQAAMPLNF